MPDIQKSPSVTKLALRHREQSDVVIQIGKYYSPEVGGIENNVRQLAQIAATCGESKVICMRKGRGQREYFKDGDVQVIRLRSYGAIWRQELVESPAELLMRLKPTVLHFHSPNPLMAFHVLSYLKKHPSVRLVISHHADLHRPESIRRIANSAFYALLQKADRIISYTHHFAKHSTEINAFQNKLEVIPHGVDVPDPDDSSVCHAQEELGRLRIGFLGRVEAWKGVQIILDAIKDEPRWSLKVAGNGSFLRNLMQQSEQKKLSKRVQFLGQVQSAEREAFFREIDCLVLPSLNRGESFGQVLVEAQLRGIPVIASDLNTGVREVCDFGRAGLLFPVGDPCALRECLSKINTIETRRELARVGKSHSVQHYSHAIVKEKVTKFYKEMLSPSIS